MAEDMHPKPSVGRIVHFNDDGRCCVGRIVHFNDHGRCFAAMITEVSVAYPDVVSLSVQPPMSHSRQVVGIQKGKPTDENTWHWPERV